MDQEKLISLTKDALEMFLGASYGTRPFWMLGAVYVISVIVVGKLLASWIGGSQRGIFATGLGLLLPCAFGLAGYVLGKIYLPGWVTEASNVHAISLGILIFLEIFTVLFITPFFLGIGTFKTLIVVILTGVVTIGIVHGVGKKYKDVHPWPSAYIEEITT